MAKKQLIYIETRPFAGTIKDSEWQARGLERTALALLDWKDAQFMMATARYYN